MLLGDALVGFYAIVVMVFVYFGFAASTLTSRLLLLNKKSIPRFLVAVFAAAVVFYAVSNIGMWWYSYPHTFNGLVACWIDGLPFLLRSISGDLVYGCLMFGIVEWTRRVEKLQIDGQPST